MLTGEPWSVHGFLREHVGRQVERQGKTTDGVTLITDEEGKIFF